MEGMRSSKGNQLKWYFNGKWYKADYLGYESLAEHIVSRLLEKTNVSNFVRYSVATVKKAGHDLVCCVSDDFLENGEEIITLQKLFRTYKGVEINQHIASLPIKEAMAYVVDNVEKITGIIGFGAYLALLFEVDALFVNEDRHFNNIAVIHNSSTDQYRFAPIFDNGGALFSDTTISFPLTMNYEECLSVVECKPFSFSFDEQIDAVEELYGYPLQYWFTYKDLNDSIDECTDRYDITILDRVRSIIEDRMYKYRYLRITPPVFELNYHSI